jgi:hypothetical protein
MQKPEKSPLQTPTETICQIDFTILRILLDF